MKRRTHLAALLCLGLFLAASGPAAAGFNTADLNGHWDVFVHGYHEVFHTYCFGSITIENGVIVSGSGDYHSAMASFTGQLSVGADGFVTGTVGGSIPDLDFSYRLVSGRLNRRGDTITGTAFDHREFEAMVFLVKTN